MPRASARGSSPTSTGRCARSRTRSRARRRWRASRSGPSTPASPAATSARQASDGVAAIAGGEVTRADVERVLEGARAIPVDADRQILHVLPREYIVDSQDGIRDPDRDERRAPRREGQPRHRGDELRAERHPLRRALRPHGRRRRARAARERRGRASATTRRRSASPSSTSAAARPTSSSTSTAASPTRASSPSAATTSRATSPRACARRWPRPTASSASPAARSAAWSATTRRSRSPASAATRRARPRAACSRDIIEPRVEEIFAVVRKRIEDTGLLEQLCAGVVLTGGAVLLAGDERVRRGDPRHAGAHRACRRASRASRSSCTARSTPTGVGLVKYGAQVTMRASALAARGVASVPPPRRSRAAHAAVARSPRPDEVGVLGVDQGGVLIARARHSTSAHCSYESQTQILGSQRSSRVAERRGTIDGRMTAMSFSIEFADETAGIRGAHQGHRRAAAPAATPSTR